MSNVVERGLARCPRCVAVADYTFTESPTQTGSSEIRYEVRCRKCGECYGEDSSPRAFDTGGFRAADHLLAWPPDGELVVKRDRRAEFRQRVTAGRKRLTAEIDKMTRRTRSLWPKGEFRRKKAESDHTGG